MRTVANYIGIAAAWFCVALVGFMALIGGVKNGFTIDDVLCAVITVVIGTLIYLVWGVEGKERSP